MCIQEARSRHPTDRRVSQTALRAVSAYGVLRRASFFYCRFDGIHLDPMTKCVADILPRIEVDECRRV